MRRRSLSWQRGQALLIVMTFVAAFLLVVVAALWLASGAFLGLSSIKTDTQTTYALDSGLAYAIETNDSAAKGSGCNPTTPPALTFTYGSRTINVAVNINPIVGCKTGKPSYGVTVAGGGRQLNAQISSSNAGKKSSWVVDWESFQ